MGFYFNQNVKLLYPRKTVSWLQPVDRTVDRRAQTSTPLLAGGPVNRPGRPSRELCSLEMPRSTGPVDRQRVSLCSRGSVDRSPNGRIFDRWRSTGRSTGNSVWSITASFWSPINWAIWGLFYTRFLVDFRASFSYSIKRFSPQN